MRKKSINNTVIHAFLLKPEQYLSEAFGIDKEILLTYSPYDVLQPRAIQAVNMLFDVFPFRNRVDTLNCFVVSKDTSVIGYAGITSFSENQSRSIVPFISVLKISIVSNKYKKFRTASAVLDFFFQMRDSNI